MARHPQLSRQQLTDLLDHAFSELEEMKQQLDSYRTETDPGFRSATAHTICRAFIPRIRQLIERLSEYK